MKIKYKKNGIFEVNFNEYFKTVDELTEFIRLNNKFINTSKLNDEISKIYNELTISDLTIKSSILNDVIIKTFNFKYKRPNNINFWFERGFGIKEFNEYNKCQTLNSLDSKDINNFIYGEFKYKMIGVPKCNICHNNLITEPMIGRYNIIGCHNSECETNKNKDITSIRQLGFLPIDVFNKKNKRINIDSKLFKEYWLLRGFTYDESLIKIRNVKDDLKNVKINSFEYYKLSTDMSDEEIILTMRKKSYLCEEYWLNKGFNIIESENKIKVIQKNNSDRLINLRINNPNNYTATTTNQIGYWINKGYSESEAKLKVSERQSTFSKKKCIEKYGEIEGLKKFTERQNNWSKSLNTNGNMKIGHSKISQELFNRLLDTYNFNDRDKIYFATHNKEFKLDKCESEGGVWLYDFTDIKNKKIIEYNGDDYHANPKKYKSTDYPHPFRKEITAQEIWDKDKRKNGVANEEGFEVLVIWDSEYRYGNKEEIINKCIKFLKNK